MKTRRKIIVTGGLLLAIILAVAALLLLMPKQTRMRSYAATYNTAGLGMGIDVAAAQEVNEFKTTYQVFDLSKIQNLDAGQVTFNKSTSNAISTTDVKTVATELGAKTEFSAGVEFPIGAVGVGLSLNSNLKYGNYIYKYYYMLDHKVERYQRYLFNSTEQSTYAECYTPKFLQDLNNLESGNLTYKEFFQRYGTHIVGKATYGGRLNAAYSVATNEVAIQSSVEAALEGAFSAGITDDIKAKITGAISEKLSMSFTQTDIDTEFSVRAWGGSVVMGDSLEGFKTGYDKWCDSFNNDSQSVIIDYPKDGLVPIWELLPSDYAHLSSAMESECKIYYNATVEKVLEPFRWLDLGVDYKGDGTADKPYLIRSEQDLKDILGSNDTENTDKKDWGPDKHYALANDITLTGTNWEPIGGVKNVSAFCGTLNGRGYSIRNFTEQIDYSGVSKKEGNSLEEGNRLYFGLFGQIGKEAIVKNLAFENVNISIVGPGVNNSSTRVMVGVLAATFYGKAQNVSVVSGSCTYTKCTNGVSYVGGLVGLASGATFENCINKAALFSGRYAAVVGGICGYAKSSRFYNCINYGSLTARCTAYSSYAAAGGIIGQTCSKTSNVCDDKCISKGKIDIYTFSSSNVTSTYYPKKDLRDSPGNLCAMTNGKDLSY